MLNQFCCLWKAKYFSSKNIRTSRFKLQRIFFGSITDVSKNISRTINICCKTVINKINTVKNEFECIIRIKIKIKEDTGSDLLNNAENIIMEKKNYDDMYLIDFGLSSVSTSTSSSLEDKAVDLYVLKRAIISSNPKSEELFEKAMIVYKNKLTNGNDIINKYKNVEMRGRKKLCFG